MIPAVPLIIQGKEMYKILFVGVHAIPNGFYQTGPILGSPLWGHSREKATFNHGKINFKKKE